LIGSSLCFRLDLTDEKLYTLSPGTKKIIERLSDPVTIRFYCTQGDNRMPMNLKIYASRVEDILAEYKRAGHGKIIIEKYNPQPDSEAEESAQTDGVAAQMLNTGDRFYLGITVSHFDKTSVLPALAPLRENILEYEICRAIVQACRKKKDIIGLISALPVLGTTTPQKTPDGRPIPPQAWVSLRELQRDFDLVPLPLDSTAIDRNIKLVLLIHPSGISEKTQFALDQFLLRGGKIIAFLDPQSYYALIKSQQDDSYQSKTSSNLDRLLKAWGLSFNTNIMLADMSFAQRITMPDKIVTIPSILNLNSTAVNRQHVVSGQLENLQMYFAGFFSGTPAKGLAMTPLIESSSDSQPVSAYLASNPELILRNFKSQGCKFVIAALLSGKFNTAFPEGRPGGDPKENVLKQAECESSVALVSDSDLLVNDACVEAAKGGFNISSYVRKNDNISLLQNLAEFLCGDSDLISVRCRSISARPFTVVNRIRSDAEQRYKNKIVDLEKDLRETENRLNQMQREKNRDQQLVMSPAQEAELKKFKEKVANAKKELKKLRHQLRADIDALETKLKWLNIALVPGLVSLFGLGIALLRKRRHSAR
ncbi:MAG: hypothetical protein A2X49_01800, partial [Lentisphaerae bacterium GWF2_52_8]